MINDQKLLLSLMIVLLCNVAPCFAQSSTAATQGPVIEKVKKEKQIPPNYFAIAFYKPNYILPYYFTGSPDQQVYRNNTPNNELIKNAEFKYQFSVKLPAWKQVLGHAPTTLYLAYSQLSYWQLYNKKTFFRETDYEPEAFLANELNWHLYNDWNLNFINVGASHQSNGFGTALERSWNRAYVEAITSTNNWMISLKPWYIISTDNNNNDIGHYLGYGRLLVSYKFDRHVVAVTLYNIIESAGRRSTAEVSWSIPITPYIKGYIQAFSGYGQSLIEYNHRTNSIGVGFALSDWA